MNHRWLTVAALQGRDLSRRRMALLVLIGLPLAWYTSSAAAGLNYAVGSGTLGVGWCVGATALFTVLGGRSVDPRLVQAGFRPWELLAGRLLMLLGASLVLSTFFATVMVLGSHPHRPGTVMLSIVLIGVVSIGVGLLAAAVVPRELEGTLLLIAFVGIQVGIPSAVAQWMPYYGPLRMTDTSLPPANLWLLTAHAMGSAALLTLVASALWHRRVNLKNEAPRRAEMSARP
jgi:hypothetical protein